VHGCRFIDLLPFGNVLDHFEWRPETTKLGEGAFGVVSKAKCTRSRNTRMKVGEEYAIKVIKKDRFREDRHWRAVLHEIEILRQINSAYCVQLYDAFQSQTSVYLVLEYVDGGELFSFIEKRGHLSEQEANLIIRQLLEALRFLHTDQRIVHRDLKPENILLVKGSLQIKIIDFGFAKFFGQAPEVASSNTPNPMLNITHLSPQATIPNTPSELIMSTPTGSPKYCAPEILKRLETQGVQPRITTRTDIQKLDMFAAGVVTFVMLGGVFPFSSKSHLAPQIERGICFPESHFKGVSEDAKDFCRIMLHPDRRMRPLAFEALDHQWLRVVAPATPLEAWQCGDPEPMDNALFDEMREMDNQLEKMTLEAASNPLLQSHVVNVRPKQEVVLKSVKKVSQEHEGRCSPTTT
jgi:serine/threonine protein kinase